MTSIEIASLIIRCSLVSFVLGALFDHWIQKRFLCKYCRDYQHVKNEGLAAMEGQRKFIENGYTPGTSWIETTGGGSMQGGIKTTEK